MHGQPDSQIYNIMTIRNIDAKFKEVSSFLGNRYQKSASVKLRIAPMYIYTIFSWQHYHRSLWFLFHPNVPEKTFWGATVTSVTGKHHNEVDDKNSSMQFINVTEKNTQIGIKSPSKKQVTLLTCQLTRRRVNSPTAKSNLWLVNCNLAVYNQNGGGATVSCTQ